MSNRVPIIKHDDEKLFEYLNVFKYLDMDFVFNHLYIGKTDKYIYRRVNQLEKTGYLNSVMLHELNDDYTSTPTRKKILINSSIANDFLNFNLRNVQKIDKVHHHYIMHQIALANALINYYESELLINDSKVEMVKFLTEQESSVSDRHINIRPDAAMILSINNINVLIFVELEKSYAKEDDIKRKLIHQYSEVHKYKHKLTVLEEYDIDINNTRVLFISTTENKKNNLLNKVKKFSNINLNLLFTTIDSITNYVIENENILLYKYDTIYDKKVEIFKKIQED